LELLRIGVIVAVLITATYTDLSKRKIYNWTTFPAIGFGVGLAGGEVVFYEAWAFMMPCLMATLVAATVFGIPYLLGWVGGGDLKLMIAVGALQGQPFDELLILSIIYNVSLMGAVMALLILIWKGQLKRGVLGSFKLLSSPKVKELDPNESLPYGLAIALGTLFSMSSSLAS
jgi:prepilin peptidase CpaA